MQVIKSWRVLVAVLIPLLSGCGGGGGGSAAATPPPPLPPPPPPPPPVSVATLGFANTGQFGGAVLQTITLARDLTELLRPGVPSALPTGTSSGACPLGGSATTEVSADRLTMIETFNNCVVQPAVDPVTLNGQQQTVWSGPAGDAAFTATVSFTDLRAVVTGGPSEATDGTISYDGSVRDVNFNSVDEFVFNVIVTSSTEGTLQLQNTLLEVQSSVQFLNDLEGVSNASGRISHDVSGFVDLGFDTGTDRITLTGAGTGIGTIESDFGRLTIAFQPDSQSPSTAFLQLDRQEIGEIEFFNSSNRFGPLRDSTFILDLSGVTVFQQDPIAISLRSNFLDRDGDLMQLNITPGDVTIRPRTGPAETVPFDDARVDVTIEQLDAGILSVSSATDGESVDLQFSVIAEDASGLASLDPLDVAFTVYLDTDDDQIADRFDSDDDNDGVIDVIDDFPLDPSESSDNDNDGIGDNADPDDDNDGSADVDDSYPLDGRCFLASDGDGSRCFLTSFQTNSDIFVDRNGVAYIHYYFGAVENRFKVFRYDTGTGHFLSTIELDPGVVGLVGPDVPYTISYAEDHHALYIGYDNTGVTQIDLDDVNLTETLFRMKDPASTYLNAIHDFGTYVVIGEQSPGLLHRYSYTEAGVLIDSYDKPSQTGSIIYVGPHNDNYCDEGVALDLQTGLFFQFNNPGLINCRILGQPAPSPDGSIALDGVSIIDQTLTEIGTIQTQGQDRRRRFINNQGVFALSGDGVEVFSLNGTPVEVIGPVQPGSSGFSLDVRVSDDVTLIIEDNNGFLIDRYIPPQL